MLKSSMTATISLQNHHLDLIKKEIHQFKLLYNLTYLLTTIPQQLKEVENDLNNNKNSYDTFNDAIVEYDNKAWRLSVWGHVQYTGNVSLRRHPSFVTAVFIRNLLLTSIEKILL